MMDENSEKVVSAIASVKHIPREMISLDSSLEGLGFDSLDRITLLFELEKQFNISVPDDAVPALRVVRDVVEGVARLVANASLHPAASEGGP
jgi:acyl carrier protein